MMFTGAKVQTNSAKFAYLWKELNLIIMKKHVLIFIFLLGIFPVFAQENGEEITKVEIVKDSSTEYSEAYGKHEIRINALDLVAHPAIHIYYERVVDESNGYGVSGLVNFGDHDATYQNFAITPYYRFYFLNRKDFGASGLFVEVFSSFSSVDFDENSSTQSNEFQFSMGIGLGKKWVNRNGFTFEAFLGLGRYFINNKNQNNYQPEAHGRFGLSIGKRF